MRLSQRCSRQVSTPQKQVIYVDSQVHFTTKPPSVQMSLSSKMDIYSLFLFFILLQFNVGVTRWPKYIFFTTLFLFVFSIFSSQALLHVLLAPDLPPPLIVIQGSFPAGRLHWHMFANNGLATLITQSSPVQIFPNVFISEANHWKPRGISYSYLP